MFLKYIRWPVGLHAHCNKLSCIWLCRISSETIHNIVTKYFNFLLWNRCAWRSFHTTYQIFLGERIPWTDLLMWILLLNPLRAFFRGNIKHTFTFYFIPPHWYDTRCWNPSLNKTRIYSFYIVNSTAAGVQAMQGANASAAMILT